MGRGYVTGLAQSAASSWEGEMGHSGELLRVYSSPRE